MQKIIKIVPTLLIAAAAILVLRYMWRYYMEDPWTRDAHINADVAQVAADVSGPVLDVRIGDNALVRRGDVLFVVDPARYEIALREAQAALKRGEAALAQNRANLLANQALQRELQRESRRDRELADLVAVEEAEARRASLEKAQAGVAAAEAEIAAAHASIASARAAIELAQLNLERTVVRSPVDGKLGDRVVRVGDYVSAGKPVLALLDTKSFRIDSYFEETRLHGVKEGDAVDIVIMGEKSVLRGHVQSIAAGIEDRYRSQGASMLPNVTPTFDWVRLAQRIPVRISLDDVPEGVHLIAGRSVTVSVVGDGKARQRDEKRDERS
ncbi:MAG: HlyD family secretion protein [Betaproteobacteria bacterium]|nr:HlyD family secretion protein [Betaproteobacteria bacterium]